MRQRDPIEDHIVAALRRIVRAVDLQSRRIVEACGLTGPQLVVLREAAQSGEASVSSLARAVSLSQPTVSGILERLEKRGLLMRERGERDRRSVVVRITPEGEHTLKSAPSLLQDRFRQELARIEDWERTQMLALLQRLAGMMDADSIDAAPLLDSGALDAARPDSEPGSGADDSGDPEP